MWVTAPGNSQTDSGRRQCESHAVSSHLSEWLFEIHYISVLPCTPLCALDSSNLVHPPELLVCYMQEALPGLLQDTHITAMVQGNFTAQEAFEMASSVRKMLSDGILTASERSVDRVAVLPHGTTLHQ